MAVNLVRGFGAIAKTCGGINLMKASYNKMRDMDSVIRARRTQAGQSFPVMTKDDWRWVVFYALGKEEVDYDSADKRAQLARAEPVWDALYHLVSFEGFDAKTGDKLVSMDRLGYTNALLFLIAHLDEPDRQSAMDDMFPESLEHHESAILFDMLTEINKREKQAADLYRRLSAPKKVISLVRPATPITEEVKAAPAPTLSTSSAPASTSSSMASDASHVDEDVGSGCLTLEAEIAELEPSELEDLVDKLPFATACNLRKLLNAKFAAVM